MKHTHKRKHRHDELTQPPPPEHSDAIDGGATALSATEDICTQLMTRYAASSATQHRHLIATAAAMKSLILDDSLPLSPLSYFAASMDALSQPPPSADSSAALGTLLSLSLPLVPEGSISPEKAGEAIRVLVAVLEDEKKGGGGVLGSTSSAKCVVKCLGVLLGFCDLGDWGSVRLGFQTLLNWSLDKRPKVRKCAVMYLENALRSFQSEAVKKKASKLIFSLLESSTCVAVKLSAFKKTDGFERKKQYEAEHLDVAHVLNVVKAALPYLSGKVAVKVVSKLVERLDAQFSALTMILLNAIDAFLNHVELEVFIQVAGDIITALSSYATSKSNPKDSVVFVVNLLKSALDKLHVGDAAEWNKSFSPTVNTIAGLLTCENDVASLASNILQNLIHLQLPVIESDPVNVVTEDTESEHISSLCSVLLNMLDGGSRIPNEHTLTVISVLFLKLGENSLPFMRDIVLKLANISIHLKGDKSDTFHLQKCFGCAIVAMGAESFLNLVPISFSRTNLTCSNSWLLPILNKFVFGASLRYFMEHMAPIGESVLKASRKVKKTVIGQDLHALARGIWGLLPAFCRHPTDISQSFQSFVKLVITRLEKDSSVREDIALALQELVTQSKQLPKSDHASVELSSHSSELLLVDYLLEKRRLFCFSKMETTRNLKAMSLSSHELLQALVNVFCVSPPEERSSLKKAINCLASISDPLVTKKILSSAIERYSSLMVLTESGECDFSSASVNGTSGDLSSITDNESQWSLILDLASSLLEGADEDLVGMLIRLIKHLLKAENATVVSEAYSALTCVLEEHPHFCSSKLNELVDLLIGLNSPAGVGCLSNRLNCFRTLLILALKSSFDEEDKRPFHILNEIILAVKDSKEEARKAAYDVLLKISSSLGGPRAANPDGPYHRLISMILGYISGPAPQITSAAISALSVLVFKEPELCLAVPIVIPSVASLLQTKAVEVIKAVLGFIKVLVSCLQPKDLQNYISVIVDGIIPWSSVSRHHFKPKVTVILEIMIRKCGLPAINSVTPERYQKFVKNVSLSRHGKTSSKDADSADAKPLLSDASINRLKKRVRNETLNEKSGSVLHKNKRGKQNQDSQFCRGVNGSVGEDKKINRFNRTKSRMFGGSGKLKNPKTENFGHASGKPWKGDGTSGKLRNRNRT